MENDSNKEWRQPAPDLYGAPWMIPLITALILFAMWYSSDYANWIMQ